MSSFPISKDVLDSVLRINNISNLDTASIRRVGAVVDALEEISGEKFVRMEIGSPGFSSPKVGIDAEASALQSGVSAKYPPIDGIKELKSEAAKFVKNFVGIDVAAQSCVPTVGSMQGVFASFITSMQRCEDKDTILFLDPGFPVQKQQLQVLGYKYISFDIYDYRQGGVFELKLREYLDNNKISSVVYSNPNNPTWICLTEQELEIIGRLATEYDFIVIEDLAYLCMDFRKDLSGIGVSPYQATVARYTKNFVIHISASKIFSYAGQRCAVAIISDDLYCRNYSSYLNRYTNDTYGSVFVNSVLYALSSGVTHSVQYAVSAMFRSANEGYLDFVKQTSEYGRRAKKVKEIFLKNNFHIPYSKDCDELIADGFFFTIAYEDMSGSELLYSLLRYGVSAITLKSTGSLKCGLRACTSVIKDDQFLELDQRLLNFNMSRR